MITITGEYQLMKNGNQVFLYINKNTEDALREKFFYEEFKKSFINFLSTKHAEVTFIESEKEVILKALWKAYKEEQNQDTADNDVYAAILTNILQNKELAGFKCVHCGKILLGRLPETDRYGDTYCNSCADKYLDCCDVCNERFPKAELTYMEGIGYCKHCIPNWVKEK